MYSTAHRVSRGGQSAINVFLHKHGKDFAWPEDATSLPEDNPGALREKWTPIKPGGNPVHSYLDVLAPDETPREAIHQALEELQRDLPERLNPTTFKSGRVTIRFGVEIGLEARREAELGSLINAIQQALQEPWRD
jgi:hypothetical protein